MKEKLEAIQLKRIDRLIERMGRAIVEDTLPFQAFFAWSKSPVPFSDRESLDFRPIAEGDRWGKAWDSAWFHLSAQVPQAVVIPSPQTARRSSMVASHR